MEIPIAEIALVLSYLNNNGGKEVVKKASIDFYNWLKGRLPGNGPQKIEAFKENPKDESAQQEAKQILAAADEFNILPTSDLQSELQKVIELMQKEEADWLKQSQMTSKTNTQTITGDGKIGIQDISGSSININKKD